MNGLFDILIGRPLGGGLLRGLLFAFFTFHITFVLLAIGTAIISVFYFLRARWERALQEGRWDKEILTKFMPLKSLAVVLGVAPLLFFQVGFPVPFYTAANLFAPLWLSLVVVLMAAFLSLDTLAHKTHVRPAWHLLFGLIGLACLLAVPGIFVAVVLTAENPDTWLAIIRHNYRLSGPMAVHWFFRYLHILGAGIVFGAAFHYFFTTKDRQKKKSSLRRWMVTGILLQVALGLMLYITLPDNPDAVALVFIGLGIIAAALLLWVILIRRIDDRALPIKAVGPLLFFVLTAMLLARQLIQVKKLLPLEKELRTKAEYYENKLRPFESEGLKIYQADLETVYDNGQTIYEKSCAFCHGEKGDGRGGSAPSLIIPPEDLSSLRTTRSYLHSRVAKGIPGSAMPYFAFFDRRKIEGVLDYLDEKWGVLGQPEDLPGPIPEGALEQAQKIYRDTCSNCHGLDGRGSPMSQAFQPGVPDFTAFGLSPRRTFEVLTEGYPGTQMPSFETLHEDVRWALVKIINDKKIPGPPREKDR